MSYELFYYISYLYAYCAIWTLHIYPLISGFCNLQVAHTLSLCGTKTLNDAVQPFRDAAAQIQETISNIREAISDAIDTLLTAAEIAQRVRRIYSSIRENSTHLQSLFRILVEGEGVSRVFLLNN